MQLLRTLSIMLARVKIHVRLKQGPQCPFDPSGDPPVCYPCARSRGAAREADLSRNEQSKGGRSIG